ncbi:hypothetical protein TrRE_jg9007, partial [Triparma retinervis]
SEDAAAKDALLTKISSKPEGLKVLDSEEVEGLGEEWEVLDAEAKKLELHLESAEDKKVLKKESGKVRRRKRRRLRKQEKKEERKNLSTADLENEMIRKLLHKVQNKFAEAARAQAEAARKARMKDEAAKAAATEAAAAEAAAEAAAAEVKMEGRNLVCRKKLHLLFNTRRFGMRTKGGSRSAAANTLRKCHLRRHVEKRLALKSKREKR